MLQGLLSLLLPPFSRTFTLVAMTFFPSITMFNLLTYDLPSYQTILDCSETNEGFYVKCGYKRVGLEMAHYYDRV